MLTVRLPGLSDTQTIVPAIEIRLADGALLLDGKEMARYRAGKWHFESFHAVTLPIDSQVKVRFESSDGRSALYGPFDQLLIDNGAIRYNRDGRDLLAWLDETRGKWSLGSSTEWDTVTIRRPHRFD
jgi:hypothetical protein